MNHSQSRILGWLVLINVLLSSLIATRFFAFYPSEALTPVSTLFAITSTLGQMLLLGVVCGLVLLPCLLLPARLRYVIMAFFAALAISVLYIDTIVFAQYRFHINAVVVGLVMAGDIVSFAWTSWLMAIGGFFAVFLFEYGLVLLLARKQNTIPRKLGRKVAWSLFGAMVLANAIHAWGAANANQPVAMVKRYLPLYYPLTANTLMKKLGLVDLDALEREKNLKSSHKKGDLSYPLHPLQAQVPTHKKDIVLLVIDSWRFDTFNPQVSPNIWALAEEKDALIYQNHISTGNATRTGIFGLFYGIPGTYWHSFLANQRSPVLMDRLQQLDYQLGIFASAQLVKPEFNQTVFRNVPDLRIRSQGNSSPEKDRNLTDDWKQWYTHTELNAPTFSFLFYDSPHAYDFPADYPHQFNPLSKEINYLTLGNDTDPEPIFNRYRTSVHFVDSLVKEVTDTLRARGKLDDTVIIITGDHGQEMNDNKLNYWGHNSNFTTPQVKVPFIIIDPSMDVQATEQYKTAYTSHEDLVPTLMKNYLGVSSETADYSTGQDLFGAFKQRDWVMSSKYSGYGIIDAESILEVNNAGGYELLDPKNRPLNNSLNSKNLSEALEHISRYLK